MKIRVARGLSLVTYLGLIGWVMLWIMLLGDVPREQVSLLLLLTVTPLLLPMRGILAGRDKAIVWGTLVCLPYAVHGGVTVWTDPGARTLGLVEVGLSMGYLFSASFFVRWRALAAAPA